MYSTADVKVANATSRGAGAVGAKAIVPRMVLEIARPEDTILDFGSGTTAQHAQMLRARGLDVTAYDFGENVRPGVHDTRALSRTYTLVYASNVLNVLSSRTMLRITIRELFDACTWDGSVVCNYPQSPRKADLRPSEIEAELCEVFSSVTRVAGTSSTPVWVCMP